MIIADAGSSNTLWYGLTSGAKWKTPGYNPNYHPDEILIDALSQLVSDPSFLAEASRIIYYGTGCFRIEPRDKVTSIIQTFFDQSHVTVYSDLTGAAHACCGDLDGVIGILGTGSSTCTYIEGHLKLSSNLGYPLGEECSGYDLARRILERHNIGFMDREISAIITDVLRESGYRAMDEIIAEPKANAVMASFFKEFEPILDNPEIEHIILMAIEDYYKFQIRPLMKNLTLPIHFVGTVATRIGESLRAYLQEQGHQVGSILPTPMPAIVKYYTSKNRE